MSKEQAYADQFKLAHSRLLAADYAGLSEILASEFGELIFKELVQVVDSQILINNQVMRAWAHAYNNFWLNHLLAEIILNGKYPVNADGKGVVLDLLKIANVAEIWLQHMANNMLVLSMMFREQPNHNIDSQNSLEVYRIRCIWFILLLCENKLINSSLLSYLLSDDVNCSFVLFQLLQNQKNIYTLFRILLKLPQDALVLKLLKLPMVRNVAHFSGNSLLQEAIANKKYNVIDELCTIDAVVETNLPILDDERLLKVMAELMQNGHVRTITALLEKNESMRKFLIKDFTVLYYALGSGYRSIANIFLKIKTLRAHVLKGVAKYQYELFNADQIDMILFLDKCFKKRNPFNIMHNLDLENLSFVKITKRPVTILTARMLNLLQLHDLQQFNKQDSRLIQVHFTKMHDELFSIAWPIVRWLEKDRDTNELRLLNEHWRILADMLYGKDVYRESESLIIAKIINTKPNGSTLFSENKLPLLAGYCNYLRNNYPSLDQKLTAAKTTKRELQSNESPKPVKSLRMY